MPSCAFRKCTNNSRNSKKDLGITFHGFPKEPRIKEKWIKIIQEEQKDEQWLPSKFTRVCSAHFSDDMFQVSATGRRWLKKNSVPSFIVSTTHPDMENPGSPLDDIYISDNESVFDTAQEIYLKRQLEIEVAKRKKYKSELYNERRKTKRLKIINANLKDIIKKLSEKCNANIAESILKEACLSSPTDNPKT